MLWGRLPQVPFLQVGAADVGCEPFTPQGEAVGFEVPPDCGLHQGWVLWQEWSQPFLPTLMSFPHIYPMGRDGSASFWIFFRADLVCPGRRWV